MPISLSGSLVLTGSITTTGVITMSGSIASATSASYSSTSDLLQGTGSVGFATTASLLTVSSSQQQISASQQQISSSLLRISSSYASTGSNTFTGIQNFSNTCTPNSFTAGASIYTAGGLQVTQDTYFSSSVYIKGNVTVFGTQSVSYVSSSQFNIGTNIITVNTFTPSVRYGGLSVFDSGSTGLTGSIFWDSELNRWIYVNASGSGGGATYGGGMFISGPRNTQGIGCEQGTTACMLLVGQGGDHLTSSLVYHDTNCTNFYSNALYISSSGNVGIGTNTNINRLTLTGGSDGLTNMLGIYNNGINNTTAIGKGTAIILGGNTDGNYSAKIAMVYEGQNPSFLQPALTFYTMNNTFAYGSEVERMRITSTGNVGIGTCTPTGTYGKLSVAGGISILNDNCAKLQIGRYSNVSTDSYIVMANGSTGLTFTNANDVADVMRITTGGNVGIGTNSPSGTGILLNVKGITGNTIGMVIAESADGCAMVSLYSGSGIGDDPSLIYLKDLRFGSGNKSTSGYVERMRIASCGNVGIGLTCPVEKLDIMGALRVRCNTPGFTAACNSLVIDYANTCVFGSSPMTRYYSIGCTGVSAGHSFLVGEPSVGYNAFIINGSGHVTKPCSAAFHAAINASTCIGPGGITIQFNCVIYNAGGGYNGTTSTFTAPVSGMYQFNFTFLNQNVQNVDGGHAYLSTSSGVGTYYFTRYGCFSGTDRTGYGNYVPMHGAIAVYLPAGARACVAAFWDGPGAFTHNSTAWSNFTGYLVG